jgi:hypothetical protein
MSVLFVSNSSITSQVAVISGWKLLRALNRQIPSLPNYNKITDEDDGRQNRFKA